MAYIATGSVALLAVLAVIAVCFMYHRTRTQARNAREPHEATTRLAHRIVSLAESTEHLTLVRTGHIINPQHGVPVTVGVAQHV